MLVGAAIMLRRNATTPPYNGVFDMTDKPTKLELDAQLLPWFADSVACMTAMVKDPDASTVEVAAAHIAAHVLQQVTNALMIVAAGDMDANELLAMIMVTARATPDAATPPAPTPDAATPPRDDNVTDFAEYTSAKGFRHAGTNTRN